MIEPVQCVVLRCDDCGVAAFDDESDLGVEYFATVADAHEAAEQEGWIVCGDRVMCLPCKGKAQCGLLGHQWGPWHAAVDTPGAVRLCWSCTTVEHDPPAPPLAERLAAS